ncbi:MAG: M28 family peptidase [Halobacteriales archaeon]|nr:M28 family peptidase [Halobacteriales archaeon]
MSEPRLPADVIGDGYTSNGSWELLEELVEIENRMAGQDGERAGAEAVAATFEGIGFQDVAIEEFEIPGWWRGTSSLALPDRGKTYDSQHQVIALPGTPAAEISGELVDLGYGLPEDFEDADLEDKIAMVRSDTPDDSDHWYHRMEKVAFAVEAGADGYVFRNHVEGCLPPTGEVGYHNRPAPLPSIGVSWELGTRLARYCEEGDPHVEVSIDCRNDPATSQNVEAVVGPDTDQEVIVTAHVDGHDIAEGAGDDGVGSALVPEIGRLLTQVEDDLDTRVRLVTVGSEEIGLYGAYHLAETTDRDRVKCVMNIDGAGGSRTPMVRRDNTFEAMAAPFETVADRLDVPFPVENDIGPHGDCWAWTERGIPAVTVGSKVDRSGRGWGHTHADTLDKLDRRDLRSLAVAYTSALLELADDSYTFPKKTSEEIRAEIVDSYERELKAGNRWHFED